MKKIKQVILDEEDLLELADILESLGDAAECAHFPSVQSKLLDLVKFSKTILDK